MKQRQHIRAKINGIEVYISDRSGFCRGTLKDFSRFGLCIDNLPRRIHPKNGYFTVIVARGLQRFNLKVQEKWEATNGPSTAIGTAIDNVPTDWTSMVKAHEPRRSSTWSL